VISNIRIKKTAEASFFIYFQKTTGSRNKVQLIVTKKTKP